MSMTATTDSMTTDPSNQVAIEVSGLRKSFCRSLKRSLWYGLCDAAGELTMRSRTPTLRTNEFWAINDLSFSLNRGECLGLIGHNGAGKTTLLKLLSGLIKPDAGTITMRGRVGALIALGAGFNPLLSGRENIFINAAVLGMTRTETHERLDEIIDFAEIRDFIDAPVQTYSSGMAVRLGFAIAAKTDPEILLLDEVLAVGDVGFQAKCFNTLAEYRESGTAFILVSHNMHHIDRYANKVLYLKHGEASYLGDPAEGIRRFTDDMHPAEVQQEGVQSGHGSGKIKLTDFRFCDANGQVVEAATPLEPMRLEIDFGTHQDVRSPVLDILAKHGDIVIFQTTSRVCGVDLGGLARRGTLRIEFKNLTANVAQLKFFICILDGDTGEVLDWHRNIPLNIETDSRSKGCSMIETNWSIHPC